MELNTLQEAHNKLINKVNADRMYVEDLISHWLRADNRTKDSIKFQRFLEFQNEEKD